MELTFPFRNISYHTLKEFQEREFQVQYFVYYRAKHDSFYKEIINKSINHYLKTLPDFENEILQVINTSNQETIDQYFKKLQDLIEWIKEGDKSKLFAEIVEYNQNVLRNFEEKVEEKTKEYFEKEERTKYKHLEEYETYELPLLFPFLNQSSEKGKKTNYNFYCIEETPDLLDPQFFEDYYNLIEKLNNEFLTIAEKYLSLYKTGKIKVNEEKFFSKAIVYVGLGE